MNDYQKLLVSAAVLVFFAGLLAGGLYFIPEAFVSQGPEDEIMAGEVVMLTLLALVASFLLFCWMGARAVWKFFSG